MRNPIKKANTDSSVVKINIADLIGVKQDIYGEGTPGVVVTDVSTTKKSSTRTKKSDSVIMTKASNNNNNGYSDKFSETEALLDKTIYEIDSLNSVVGQELKGITASKTLKKKYDYMTQLIQASGNLLNTKVSTIREKNKIISDCINLEIKLAKENKAAEETDDKRIMDMYNAFINTPIGTYNGPIAPTNVDMVLGNDGTPIMTRADGMYQTDDIGYNEYMNNLSPEQRRIQMENNPDIKTVVVFDPETGNRYFDNINLSTNTSIPGLPLPDPHFLDDLNLNVNTGVARNTNLNLSYPIVVKRSAPSFEGF